MSLPLYKSYQKEIPIIVKWTLFFSLSRLGGIKIDNIVANYCGVVELYTE